MPGSGTDKTKPWTDIAGPIVVLVEPQLGQNIGTVARAMANFGLSRLRLVKPRDGWPNPRARIAASGADRVLDQAQLFDRFFRTRAATDQAVGGTGLGLTITKAIVDAHRGSITIESTVGKESIFSVRLPDTKD